MCHLLYILFTPLKPNREDTEGDDMIIIEEESKMNPKKTTPKTKLGINM